MERNDSAKKRNGFMQVFDHRNRRVRGLWIRNGIYYAQMRLPGHVNPVRVRLHDDHTTLTVPQAIKEMQARKLQREAGDLVVDRSRGVPGFSTVADDYLAELEVLGKKRPATIKREKSCILALKLFFKDKPVTKIVMSDCHAYAKWRKKNPSREGMSEVSGRAIDVDIVTLRNVMKKAHRDGLITRQPIGEWEQLADDPPEMRLVQTDEIEKLRKAAREHVMDGQQFSDYLGLLAFSGGREQETLRLRWSVNVDSKHRRLGFGQDGLSKFGKSRWVPFNPAMEELLKDMKSRRKKGKDGKEFDLLFPSPRGGGVITSYKNALAKVKKLCGVTDFGFHHLRHYFISHSLMSGVDLKTVSEWAGHEDVDVTAQIYAHIANKHSQKQAAKVEFS